MKKTLCLLVCIVCLLSLTVNAGVPVGGLSINKDVITQDYEDTTTNTDLALGSGGASVGASGSDNSAAIITCTQGGRFYTENAALKVKDGKYTISFDVYAETATTPLKLALDTGLEKPYGIVIYPGSFLASGAITKTDLTGKVNEFVSSPLDYTTSVPLVSSASVAQVCKWFSFEVTVDLSAGKDNISFKNFPEEIISVKFKERGAAQFKELSSARDKIYTSLYGYNVFTNYGGIMPSDSKNVTMMFYAYNNGNGNDDLGKYNSETETYTALAQNAEYHIDNVMVNYEVAKRTYIMSGHVFGYEFEDSILPKVSDGSAEIGVEADGNRYMKLIPNTGGYIGAVFLNTGIANTSPDKPIQIDHKDYSISFDIYRKSGAAGLKFELYENFGREFVESTTDLIVGIDGKKAGALNVLMEDGERYDYILSSDGLTLTKYRRILDIASIVFSDSAKESALPNGAWYTYKIASTNEEGKVKIVRKLRDSENSQWEEIEAEVTKGVLHGIGNAQVNTVEFWNYGGHSVTDEIWVDNFVFGRNTTASVTESKKTASQVTATVHAEDASKIADKNGEIVMVLAVYDKTTGRMIDCDYRAIPADAGYAVAELSAKANSIDNIAKVFVWNSMEPKLTEKIVIE